MKKKVILVIIDGLGDLPIPELDHKTPLESANTPMLDMLASKGICGMNTTIAPGIPPGSDTAHLSLFGYDPKKYYTGRGIFEAAGLGIPLKPGDIAFRTNYATVKNGIVVDRRAGRINDDDNELAKVFTDLEFDGIIITYKPSVEHRGCLVLHGNGLSDKITSNDPKIEGNPPATIQALDNDADKTVQILSKLINEVETRLGILDFNKRRVAEDKLPANALLVRGASSAVNFPNFQKKYGLKGASCIAGGALYKGAATLAGMSVINVQGATGRVDSDLKAKVTASIQSLENDDFVFLHFKGADNEAHDGNFIGKTQFLERIDSVLEPLTGMENVVLAITGDHSTPCSLRDHSADPTPILIYFPNCRNDKVDTFSERSAISGGLGHLRGTDTINTIMGMANRTKKFGA